MLLFSKLLRLLLLKHVRVLDKLSRGALSGEVQQHIMVEFPAERKFIIFKFSRRGGGQIHALISVCPSSYVHY